jgi:hypothetical protein
MKITFLFAAAVFTAALSSGQEEKAKTAEAAEPARQVKYYRLDFVVKEVEDGKVVNARSYSASWSNAPQAPAASIRTGSRVPIQGAGGAVQYVDVGINIDVRRSGIPDPGPAEPQGGQDQLAMNVSADVSSVAAPLESAMNAPPVVRNNRWSSVVIVPVRKPTVIFSSDDVASKRKMQLEVTATPIQ